MWGRASSGRSSARLGERRRVRRHVGLTIFLILFLLLLAAAVYGLQQNTVRIAHINIFGADDSLSAYARDAMQGSYLGLVPRDSIFFFPADRIRADILASHLDFAAVSLFRDGLTGLSIKVDTRVPIARWCDTDCYLFDASGFIYATSSAAQPINSFSVYEPLDHGSLTSMVPIGSTLSNADKLPSAFDFARELATLGSPVGKIVIHGGEVDDYLNNGTRITYILGHEQDAFTALVSARDNFNLSDGSVDYVDLRFGGKVYVKKKSATVSQ